MKLMYLLLVLGCLWVSEAARKKKKQHGKHEVMIHLDMNDTDTMEKQYREFYKRYGKMQVLGVTEDGQHVDLDESMRQDRKKEREKKENELLDLFRKYMDEEVDFRDHEMVLRKLCDLGWKSFRRLLRDDKFRVLRPREVYLRLLATAVLRRDAINHWSFSRLEQVLEEWKYSSCSGDPYSGDVLVKVAGFSRFEDFKNVMTHIDGTVGLHIIDFNELNIFKDTALRKASYMGRYKTLEYLLANKGRFNISIDLEVSSKTALTGAVVSRHYDAVRQLLDAGANPLKITNGLSLLQLCVENVPMYFTIDDDKKRQKEFQEFLAASLPNFRLEKRLLITQEILTRVRNSVSAQQFSQFLNFGAVSPLYTAIMEVLSSEQFVIHNEMTVSFDPAFGNLEMVKLLLENGAIVDMKMLEEVRLVAETHLKPANWITPDLLSRKEELEEKLKHIHKIFSKKAAELRDELLPLLWAKTSEEFKTENRYYADKYILKLMPHEYFLIPDRPQIRNETLLTWKLESNVKIIRELYSKSKENKLVLYADQKKVHANAEILFVTSKAEKRRFRGKAYSSGQSQKKRDTASIVIQAIIPENPQKLCIKEAMFAHQESPNGRICVNLDSSDEAVIQPATQSQSTPADHLDETKHEIDDFAIAQKVKSLVLSESIFGRLRSQKQFEFYYSFSTPLSAPFFTSPFAMNVSEAQICTRDGNCSHVLDVTWPQVDEKSWQGKDNDRNLYKKWYTETLSRKDPAVMRNLFPKYSFIYALDGPINDTSRSILLLFPNQQHSLKFLEIENFNFQHLTHKDYTDFLHLLKYRMALALPKLIKMGIFAT